MRRKETQGRSSRGLWAKVSALEAQVSELRELAVTIRAYAKLGMVVFPLLTSTASGVLVWLLTRKP